MAGVDLVTGGLGFIGNELVRQLKASGRSVVILDNENRVAPNIGDLSDVPLLKADITEISAVEQVFSRYKPERVFHLAAIHYIPECNADPAKTLRVNVEGTSTVLDAAIRSGCHHFIFASSGAVYHDQAEPLSEEAPVAPVDVYGWSKWFGEELCRWKSSEISVSICRLFNNIGLRETNAHILPEIVSQLKSGQRTLKLGNISPVRDYISTQDTAKALILLSDRSHPGATVFNVATGEGLSVRQMIDTISALLETEIKVQTDPERFRKADKEVQVANVSKLKQALQWSPEHRAGEVIRELLVEEGLLQR